VERVLEAIFSNSRLFLDQRKWQNALYTAISIDGNGNKDRSDALVSFWSISACVASLFSKVTEVVMNWQVDALGEIVDELVVVQARYVAWYHRWNGRVTATADSVGTDSLHTSAPQKELLVKYSAFLALVHRCLFSLTNHPDEEKRATSASKQVVDLVDTLAIGSVSGLHARVMLHILCSILSTTAQWPSLEAPKLMQPVAPELFTVWCSTGTADDRGTIFLFFSAMSLVVQYGQKS
jgi:hypothetical protein